MNILHLVPSIGRQSGGLGPVATSLAREQRLLGHDTAIWCTDPADRAGDAIQDEGAGGQAVLTYPIMGPSQIRFSPVMEQAALSPNGRGFDVLHQHGIWLAISRATARWRSAFNQPTIIAPHGSLEVYALRRSRAKKWLAGLLYEDNNLRTAACLHALSEAEALALRMYGLRNPIAVIPNGISESWLQSRGSRDAFLSKHMLPDEGRVLLFLSRIHPKKGLPLLVNALAGLRSHLKNWTLVIAGPDEIGHQREVVALVNTLDLAAYVRFVGPLFGRDKRDAFAAADVFVLPSRSEGAPIAVLEALGVGIPVLTTRGTPWQELVTHGCGWWAEVSVEGLQDALHDAFRRSRNELVVMGQRGRELVAGKYAWSQMAQESIVLYDWLLGCSAPPSFVMLD